MEVGGPIPSCRDKSVLSLAEGLTASGPFRIRLFCAYLTTLGHVFLVVRDWSFPLTLAKNPKW